MEEKQPLYVFLQDEAAGAEKSMSTVMHEAVWCRLPEDVLVQVLMRVPVLSNMRFRCVCRKWQALMSDPSFVALCPAPQGMCSLGREPGFAAGWNSLPMPDSVLRVRTLSLSFLLLCNWMLLASDKGLLLLGVGKSLTPVPQWQNAEDLCLCVCNPVSKSWVQLPPMPTRVCDGVLGTFLVVDAAAKAYRVVVVAGKCYKLLVLVYTLGASVWEQMDWFTSLCGSDQVVLGDGVIYGYRIESRRAPYTTKLFSFSLELGRPLGETELAMPNGARHVGGRLAVHEGFLLLGSSCFQGFRVWKLDPKRMHWELVFNAPDELFLTGCELCYRSVMNVSTVREFIAMEYDVVRAESRVEEVLAFHPRLKTWHAWHLPVREVSTRSYLERKLVSFDPDWTLVKL